MISPSLDRLAAVVRHPALTLDLFTTEPPNDSGDPWTSQTMPCFCQALAPRRYTQRLAIVVR